MSEIEREHEIKRKKERKIERGKNEIKRERKEGKNGIGR